jgi:hypothetical protein
VRVRARVCMRVCMCVCVRLSMTAAQVSIPAAAYSASFISRNPAAPVTAAAATRTPSDTRARRCIINRAVAPWYVGVAMGTLLAGSAPCGHTCSVAQPDRCGNRRADRQAEHPRQPTAPSDPLSGSWSTRRRDRTTTPAQSRRGGSRILGTATEVEVGRRQPLPLLPRRHPHRSLHPCRCGCWRRCRGPTRLHGPRPTQQDSTGQHRTARSMRGETATGSASSQHHAARRYHSRENDAHDAPPGESVCFDAILRLNPLQEELPTMVCRGRCVVVGAPLTAVLLPLTCRMR